MRILLFVLIILLVSPAYAQRRKKSDDETVPSYVEGITYSLPRTGIRIYVKAIKEEFQPGPYAAYADQLLGVSDAKTKASVNWSIEDVKMETFSEPDPAQLHKAMGDAAFLVSLTPEGCLAGINKAAGATEMKRPETNRFIPKTEKEDGFSFANFNDLPMYTPGDSSKNFRPVRIGIEQKAAEAANRILEARRFQYDIPAGLMDEFHPDGEAYKVSLRELEKIENNYLSLFTGRTTYKTQSFSFDFIPGTSSRKGDVVFRFSDENGVLPASDLSGKPVMLKVSPVENMEEKYSAITSSDNPSAGESGIYYRIPGIADIELVYELKTIAQLRTLVAQFGAVAPLPEELLFGDYAVEIHPETGAVKSVTKK